MSVSTAADRMSRARAARRAAFGVPVAITSMLWLGDGAWLGIEEAAGTTWLRACVLTLPLMTVLGVLCGVVGLGLGALASLDREPPPPAFATRVRAWLVDGDATAHVRRIAQLGALLSVATLAATTAYFVGIKLVIDLAQPRFIALSMIAAHVLIALAAWALLWPLRSGLHVLVERLSGLPVVGSFFRATWQVALSLLVIGLAGATWIATRASFELSFLPWQGIAKVAGAVVAGFALHALFVRLPRFVRLALVVLCVLLPIAATTLAAGWGTRANAARVLAEEHTLSGAIGYRMLRAAIDFDADGHVHVLGGGDCAPHNAAIHPGAIDIPHNRIDEDCDGEDLIARDVESPGGYRFDVPRQWPRQPPIVLITVDAFATTRMAAFGNKDKVTPNIDQFAKNAALFRACFAQGPSTRLSVPSLFTSRWDTQIEQRLEGKHPYPIADSELMLAEVIQKEGYDTVAVLPDGYFDPARWKGITDGFKVVDTSAYRDKARATHNAPQVTDVALAELAKPRKRPLFLWLHYYDAHSPHTQPADVPRRGNTVSALYDAELNLVDREVGRLLKQIDQADEKPVIVLTADHGIDFNKTHHAKYNYGYDLYSSVLHVPLIVRVPGAPTGRHEHIVSTMDVAPTLVNLLRLNGRFPFQGVSLVRELANDYQTDSRQLIHQFYVFESYWRDEDPLVKIALRTERFNLIHDRRLGNYELYDWRADYYEATDLSGDAHFTDVFNDMRRQLASYTFSLHRRPPPTPGTPARRR